MRSRIAALLAVMVLAGTACGARLSDRERAIGLAAGGGGGALAGTGGLSGTLTGGGKGGGGLAGGGLGGGTTSGSSGGGLTGGGSTGGGPGGGGGGGDGGAPPPQGGNGGSTDTGVTADSIRIAAIADVSGPQQGLFRSAQQAVQALAAFVNSQGGLYGRNLEVDAYDDQTNSGGNRARTQQACDDDFAIVGSMSAFDDGGADVAKSCGVVDIPAIAINAEHSLSPTVHSAYPNRPDYFIIGTANYMKRTHPDVIKDAGIIWLSPAAAKNSAAIRRRAYEKVGFNFIYKQEAQVVDNYTPYVLDMRQRGVKYLTMVGNIDSIAQLLQAMRQQGWYPEVRDWDSVVYDQRFLDQAGPAANGSFFFQDTALFEEAGQNKEMQLYLYWLNKVAPGADPTYFGEYAWSAARLFVKAALDVGPNLTRKAMNAALEKIHSWSDYGMHAAHDIGRQIPSPCFLYGKIVNEQFQRLYPSSGFSCNDGGILHLG